MALLLEVVMVIDDRSALCVTALSGNGGDDDDVLGQSVNKPLRISSGSYISAFLTSHLLALHRARYLLLCSRTFSGFFFLHSRLYSLLYSRIFAGRLKSVNTIRALNSFRRIFS